MNTLYLTSKMIYPMKIIAAGSSWASQKGQLDIKLAYFATISARRSICVPDFLSFGLVWSKSRAVLRTPRKRVWFGWTRHTSRA